MAVRQIPCVLSACAVVALLNPKSQRQTDVGVFLDGSLRAFAVRFPVLVETTLQFGNA